MVSADKSGERVGGTGPEQSPGGRACVFGAAPPRPSPFWMSRRACLRTRALRRNRHSRSLRIWLSRSCSSGICKDRRARVTWRCGGGSPSPGGPLRTRRHLPSAGFGGSEAKDPRSPRATRRPAPQGPTVGVRLRPHGRGCWRGHEGCAGPDLPTDCPHLKREAGRRGALTGSAFAPRCQRAEASSETGAPGAAPVSSCGLCAPGGQAGASPPWHRGSGRRPPGGRAGKG